MGKGNTKGNRKTLYQIAEEQGYTPGEFTVQRFVETIKILQEWKTYIDAGRAPPGLEAENYKEAYEREVADMLDQERSWAKFFHPEMKSTDVAVDLGEESLLALLQARAKAKAVERSS